MVISYILLSSPDVDWLWGVISLILSWVVVAVLGHYITEEYFYVFTKFISGNILAQVLLLFFTWLVLYAIMRRFTEGAFDSRDLDEIAALLASFYGAFLGTFFFFMILAGFAIILANLFVCIKVLLLATRVRLVKEAERCREDLERLESLRMLGKISRTTYWELKKQYTEKLLDLEKKIKDLERAKVF
uniref:Uncharacterized protein n=1 Tax=Thermofilum pendens TaxID=2269 RepID=A0A7C1P6I7_THEPE